MGNVENFTNAAKGLSKNPLGIVALFVVLVYALACLVFGLSSGLSAFEHLLFVIFLVLFPVVIFGVFIWVVTAHHVKLFAPTDFSDEKHFVNLINRMDEKIVDEINKKVAELEDKFEYEISYLRMTSALVRRRYDIAISWADKYLERKEDSEMLVQKAFCLWETRKDETPLLLLNKAFQVDNFKLLQSKATAHYNRACYRASLGKDTEKAIKDLKAAISIDSKYIQKMQEDKDLKNIDTGALAKTYK